MVYRKLGRTGADVSAVGLGCEHLVGMDKGAVSSVIGRALDCGANYMDIFMAQREVRGFIGDAIKGKRDKVMLQAMLGAAEQDGQTIRITDPVASLKAFEEFYTCVGTDYVDVCSLFFVDEPDVYEKVFGAGGNAEQALKLKEQGRVRFIGMSSHNPVVALKAVKTGLIDVLMFPVNPAHNTRPGGETIDELFDRGRYAQTPYMGVHPDRAALFEACEASGVAIVSMKTYGAGWLLSEDAPEGARMTTAQLIHYALSQPGVAATLPGCRTPEEVDAAMAYLSATDAERDFSFLADSALFDARGACMYCNHCQPCPVNIDIAAVTRLKDAAASGGVTDSLKGAYAALDAKASDCIACGACEALCPFNVGVIDNMKLAASYYG